MLVMSGYIWWLNGNEQIHADGERIYCSYRLLVAALCVQLGDIGPVGHFVETVEDSPVGVEAEEGHQEAQQAQHQPHHRHVLRPIRNTS